ncbi:hypothetical protein WME90_34580 [Sorangium sp. So ce375]|uniref:hypothetical protein n=1 Tax=Sorangium sp. So ce375 TaxID=3133306 RepID=UPI003F5B0E39
MELGAESTPCGICILCAIIERATITKILEHLGMSVHPLPAKRGRDPTRSEAPPIGADL